jgi:hypothetical protein
MAGNFAKHLALYSNNLSDVGSRRKESISLKIPVKNGVLGAILMNHIWPKNRYATILTRNLRHNITILYVNAIIHEWYV